MLPVQGCVLVLVLYSTLTHKSNRNVSQSTQSRHVRDDFDSLLVNILPYRKLIGFTVFGIATAEGEVKSVLMDPNAQTINLFYAFRHTISSHVCIIPAE